MALAQNIKHVSRFLKSSSKPNLKTEVVAIPCYVAQTSLFVLSYKRKLIRNAILKGQHLILVLRKVRSVCDAQVVIYLPPDSESGRRIA